VFPFLLTFFFQRANVRKGWKGLQKQLWSQKIWAVVSLFFVFVGFLVLTSVASYEDLYIETPTVREALRRLPDELMQGRLRRMKTASQCYATGTELPVEEQVTDEEDEMYLTPYLEEVEKEELDRVAYWQ
jgi:hypothetical protein